jgi:hypothetical protein
MTMQQGLLDHTAPRPGSRGCDGLAVAVTVGTFGQSLTKSFDLADIGFALVGADGNGDGGGGVRG